MVWAIGCPYTITKNFFERAKRVNIKLCYNFFKDDNINETEAFKSEGQIKTNLPIKY